MEEGFLLAALEVISGSSSNPGVQQAAAVAFKNHVKAYWCPRDSDSAEHIVPAGEKEETRKHILRLMLNSPPLGESMLVAREPSCSVPVPPLFEAPSCLSPQCKRSCPRH